MRQPRYHECTKEEWNKMMEDRQKLLNTRVPMEECVKGRLYKLACRNLGYGVWNGVDGFIGLREKFGNVYLFTEYHWDTGAPFGTVEGMLDTGVDFPGEVSEYNEDLFKWLKEYEERNSK